jgi:multidrug resistance efflux pump
LSESRLSLGAAEKAYQNGAYPEQSYRAAIVAFLKAEMDERIAQAGLESAQAELEHYVVTAPIAGIVSRLNVHPGMVSRPGTTAWGEILDLSVTDVRCEVTPEQADRRSVGQAAEVRPYGNEEAVPGQVVFVGIMADQTTGLVPILVRLFNPKGRVQSLPCARAAGFSGLSVGCWCGSSRGAIA